MNPGAFFCRADPTLTVGLARLTCSSPSKRTTPAALDLAVVSGFSVGGSGRLGTSFRTAPAARDGTAACEPATRDGAMDGALLAWAPAFRERIPACERPGRRAPGAVAPPFFPASSQASAEPGGNIPCGS